MPGIGPIRNSAPIKQAAAKQELEEVRRQLSRFKNDVPAFGMGRGGIF
jgi:hypothetical protein